MHMPQTNNIAKTSNFQFFPVSSASLKQFLLENMIANKVAVMNRGRIKTGENSGISSVPIIDTWRTLECVYMKCMVVCVSFHGPGRELRDRDKGEHQE